MAIDFFKWWSPERDPKWITNQQEKKSKIVKYYRIIETTFLILGMEKSSQQVPKSKNLKEKNNIWP